MAKVKWRTCDICVKRKKVVEFHKGRICIECGDVAPTLRDDTSEDIPLNDSSEGQSLDKFPSGDSLDAKVDRLNQRIDRIEELLLGLMELVGKINYDLELNKNNNEE